ncbi:hypothetical protein CCH79_00016186 [Gambusia affinis]|uniref:Uncharacterized protein n=1 Tax=Gambusia affinis TaxID=33528 RepID=A0A315VN78_GAMAF|nr:hypothetical protein CCH79_00016186 [Gambusia affinis]
MERMEVDQCAGAGGGALRRSNSAPMITNVSDGMTVFSPVSSARYRRSSVSINPSQVGNHGNTSEQSGQKAWTSTGPKGLEQGWVVPLSPFSLSGDRLDHKRPGLTAALLLPPSASSLVPASPGGLWEDHASTWFPSQDSGVTPNSSPSPTRRFRF